MSDSELPAATLAPPATEELVEIGAYESVSAASERGLVVLALGFSYWLIEEAGTFRLRIEASAVSRVREQLARFEREALHWPPAPLAPAAVAAQGAVADATLWALAVVVWFWAQTRWPAMVDVGALDAARVFQHAEIWRAATALWLHAGPAHVLANLVSGVLVLTALISTFGRARGWTQLALSAIAGNLASAALHPAGVYRSLGASTGIFAGLGLLTGNAVRIAAASKHPHRWRAMFVPLGAGATVLALYGAGEMHVDVLAHLCGFACGLVLGLVAGARQATAAQS